MHANEDQRPEIDLGIQFEGQFSAHDLPATSARRDPGAANPDVFMDLHQTRFFADGGTTVNVVCRPVAFVPNSCVLDISLSGYCVPLP